MATTRGKKTKGLIRSLNRSQAATGKARSAERSGTRLPEPAACEQCGAIFSRRAWRRDAGVTHALLGRVRWMARCPACEQIRQGSYFGRVVITGDGARASEDLIRRRIQNVATQAATTQPERRVVSIERSGDGLEVLTTSQKLAHRIVHELKKVMGGKARYAWSDDRSLYATWSPASRPRPAKKGSTTRTAR
jgi:NMD protein affecting ribosome stability and mRNA decay